MIAGSAGVGDKVGAVISAVLLTEVTLPSGHPRAGVHCPVFGFVIHRAQGCVLVDTGLGVGQAAVDELFTPVHHPLDEALASAGVARADVRVIINSHLHADHCGNNRLFPGVPLVVQEAEYEQARQPRYTLPEWVDFPGAEWRPVRGEAVVLPGIRVFPTPGHTAGHQSVEITRADAIEVVAGQAVYDRDELDGEASVEPLDDVEAAQTTASARRIKALNPARVYFSHDRRVWTPPAG